MAEQQVSLPQTVDELVPPQSVLSANWLRDQKAVLAARRYKLARDWGVPVSLLLDESGAKTVTQTASGIGALGAIGIAVAAAAIPSALAAWLALRQPNTPVPINTNVTKTSGFLIDLQPPK